MNAAGEMVASDRMQTPPETLEEIFARIMIRAEQLSFARYAQEYVQTGRTRSLSSRQIAEIVTSLKKEVAEEYVNGLLDSDPVILFSLGLTASDWPAKFVPRSEEQPAAIPVKASKEEPNVAAGDYLEDLLAPQKCTISHQPSIPSIDQRQGALSKTAQGDPKHPWEDLLEGLVDLAEPRSTRRGFGPADEWQPL